MQRNLYVWPCRLLYYLDVINRLPVFVLGKFKCTKMHGNIWNLRSKMFGGLKRSFISVFHFVRFASRNMNLYKEAPSSS